MSEDDQVQSRRSLLKKTLGLWFLWSSNYIARGASSNPRCFAPDDGNIKEVDNAIGLTEYEYLLWIRPYYGGVFDPSRIGFVCLVLFLRRVQSHMKYIDRLILVDDTKTTLYTYYYQRPDPGVSFVMPYILYDKIPILDSDRISFVMREIDYVQKKSQVYRLTVTTSRLTSSKMTDLRLPGTVKSVLGNSRHGGFFQTVYRFQSEWMHRDGQDLIQGPTPLIRVQEIHEDGRFDIRVKLESNDSDSFQRYTIVTDPVGRLLGFTYRESKGTQYEGEEDGFIRVTHMGEKERSDLQVMSEDIGDLKSCPYLMVFAENSKNHASYAILWFPG